MGEIVLAIIEVLKTALFWFLPWTVLQVYERGVILRLGNIHVKKRGQWKGVELIGPGLIWHCPFRIDRLESTNVVYETGEAADLVVRTKDGKSVMAHAIAGYSVTNAKKFLLEVEEASDVVLDAVGGAVTAQIRKTDLEAVLDPQFDETCRKEVSRRFTKFGVKLETLYFHKLAPLSLRDGVITVVSE